MIDADKWKKGKERGFLPFLGLGAQRCLDECADHFFFAKVAARNREMSEI